ncbi:hypothetical protein BDY19DRAFT_908395 [Irpex rosettiformis]|uniref:Uncharacterized protein n=1 Tax=Irpex rosettiformis TaxID=378272 RepID=A0ACB8TWU6_9APHY|nr:hypothetical protein BDY19DRAFT_908395 [Irpex rosettiformis]
MPASTRYSRTASPTRSTSTSGATAFNQQQLPNVVKKLAIEGKAEKGSDGRGDGASLKMYLKIALPLNSVVPGSTIPLFKEENLKILDSQVHPLDNNSAPFNFATTTNPLLRKAGRALNLPARSKDSYMSLFGSAASSSSTAAPLEDRYTGHILVTGYHVSYVLPKELPSRAVVSGSIGRRATSPEIHFMAAIDMWVPFLTRPPHSPYLLSLPVPRCLSNHIRLRIFAPNSPSVSASLASLSSVEGDATSWDLTSDPHVTRSASKRLTRSHSYQNFADEDTSDDSTTGFSDGYGIQGSFPSTDRMRVRWAAPLKSSDVPETSDGRRRVGIREVKGDMTCVVLDRMGKGKDREDDEDADTPEGIVMKVEYTATCKGVWFPGVATMLGMDVSLDAGDSEVLWVPGEEQKWAVTGGSGFTGFAVGPPPHTTASKESSADALPLHILPSTPNGRQDEVPKTNGHRSFSQTSSLSLLRAPLPSQSMMDDSSFDGSPTNTPLSSIASLPTVSSSIEHRKSRASSVGAWADSEESPETIRPPKVPISIHLNMNEIVPPQRGAFTFTISGTILVLPTKNPFLLSQASLESTTTGASELLPLPQFRALSAEKESITTIVRNELDDLVLDIFNSTGKLSDPQSRKTVLQPGGQTKCGAEGARLSVRSLTSPSDWSRRSRRDQSVDGARRPPSRPRTPNSALQRQSSSASLRQNFFMGTPKPKRDGPLMIPRVDAKITPLIPQGSTVPTEYAVRVSLPAPSDADSDWVEFGLAPPPEPSSNSDKSSKRPQPNGPVKSNALPPQVQVASASYEGVPVKFETSTIVKPEGKLPALGLSFEEASAKEWMTWVRVHVGESGGGTMEVVYLVKADQDSSKTGKKRKLTRDTALNVLLPTFSLPVGVMEVSIETQSEFELTSLQHNFTHQQTSSNGRTLTQYSLEEYFYPTLAITLTGTSKPSNSGWLYACILAVIVCTMATTLAARTMKTSHALFAELGQAQQALESCSSKYLEYSGVDAETVIITETSTIYATSTVSTISTVMQQQRPLPTPNLPLEATTSIIQYYPDESTDSETALHSTSSTTMTTITQTLVKATPTNTPPDDSSLSPITDMTFPFPVRFDISSFDIPDAARNTAQVVLRGLGLAWQFCRKVYHYPLPPP